MPLHVHVKLSSRQLQAHIGSEMQSRLETYVGAVSGGGHEKPRVQLRPPEGDHRQRSAQSRHGLAPTRQYVLNKQMKGEAGPGSFSHAVSLPVVQGRLVTGQEPEQQTPPALETFSAAGSTW